MTDRSDFEVAWDAFLNLPYPAYPRLVELRDWAFGLLDLDSWVAGYATRVRAGTLRPDEVPGLDSLVSEIASLRISLEQVELPTDEDRRLAGEYRAYVADLERILVELDRLAGLSGGEGK